MGILFEMVDDILVAILSGELDHHNSGAIRESIDRTFDTFQARHLILSFREVTFMDSSGVGLVMGRYNKTAKKQGRLSIVGCSDYIDRIFDMAAVYTIAKRYPDTVAAIRELREERKEESLWNTSIK